MSQRNVQERKGNKRTTAEIRNYLKERYKKSGLQKIDIDPPKMSRKPDLYQLHK